MRPASLSAAVLAALLASGALLSGCFSTEGPTKVAGGTIETTNGIVVMTDGRPAARVKVRLLDDEDWLPSVREDRSNTYKEAETDDDGFFEMERDTSHKVSFYASAEGQGVYIPNVSAELLKTQYQNKLKLAKNVDYRGQVDLGSGAVQVYFAGTPLTGMVDEQGEFTIRGVPPQRYRVVVRRVTPDQQVEYVTAGEVVVTPPKPDTVVIPRDTLRPEPGKAVLLDDFETGDNRTLLGLIFGNGYWNAFDDKRLGGNSTLGSPTNGAPQYWAEALVDDSPTGTGSSLKVQYTMGSVSTLSAAPDDRPLTEERAFPYVYIAVDLGAGKLHRDLSKMDTLSFWAKGSGKVVAELIQNPSGIPLHITASQEVLLIDAWQRFAIPVSDLKVDVQQFPANPSAVRAALEEAGVPAYTAQPSAYEATGGKFRTIRFLGTGGTSFQLDDIRFQGLVLSDM